MPLPSSAARACISERRASSRHRSTAARGSRIFSLKEFVPSAKRQRSTLVTRYHFEMPRRNGRNRDGLNRGCGRFAASSPVQKESPKNGKIEVALCNLIFFVPSVPEFPRSHLPIPKTPLGHVLSMSLPQFDFLFLQNFKVLKHCHEMSVFLLSFVELSFVDALALHHFALQRQEFLVRVFHRLICVILGRLEHEFKLK